MSKHTPGPWTGIEGISGPDGKLICEITDFFRPKNEARPMDVAVANLNLIKAAPDMYRALKMIQAMGRFDDLPVRTIMSAIEKAEGRE